jgi:hypothetical protein
MQSADFEAALAALPEGYSEGIYEGRRYGVSFRRSDDGRRNSLIARELAGTDVVSFQPISPGIGQRISQTMRDVCGKVREFVLGFRLSASNAAVNRSECPTSA